MMLVPAPIPGRPGVFGDDTIDKATALVWTVEDFLPREACAGLVERAEAVGFVAATINRAGGTEMRPDLRNNTRLILDDPSLAASLFDRIRPHVPEWMYGDARVAGVNERFRFYRYHPGQRFVRHFDGSFRRSAREESQLTFMVYLNDAAQGGATRFLDLDVDVTPATGTALLFQHRLLHEGAEVTSGVKYVLRTDVMYRVD